MLFETIFAALCFLFVSGVFIDGWAHNHLPGLETFFTPWHALLYGGYFLVGAWLLFNLLKKRRAGAAWRNCLPDGYGLSFIGAIIFFLAGNGDVLWHTLFGVEQDVEALFSPTHLGLVLGAVLMVGGGFRAAWRRGGSGPKGLWPAVMSLLMIVSVLSFITQYAHPVRVKPAGPVPMTEQLRNDDQALGAAGLVMQTALLAAVALLAARRWKLPFGAMTLIFGVNMIGMSFMADQYRLIPGALLAGILADVLLLRAPGPLRRPRALRVFGFIVPFAYTLFYFLTLMATGGVWWSVHMWTGAVVESAAVGYLLAYLMTLSVPGAVTAVPA